MRIELVQVGADKKEILRNLMQFYIYDFSTFLDLEVDGATGSYPSYPDLDKWWDASSRHVPYLLNSGGYIAGFASVELLEGRRNADFYMTEFFVLRKYRRLGVGSDAAVQLFDKYQGTWLVSQISTNLPAQMFWRKIIKKYTAGNYEEDSHFDNRQITQRFSS
ncbi:GNAT family N-acetyltransferase [Paenibacillus sp. J22TS3]|uniref:GNAT family N-acetyltransferase n=1 Tax=Paenibacillus sp. J22TS3 TaxID=2807192 RepID=UPI001B240693|nr:GNAT family N-acetyltransferase [Paenibacillus sp. J22TS3]GIP19868.1 acetyltransferase [Paenibacillus sp. J22TS3]